MNIPRKKTAILIGILVAYIGFGIFMRLMVISGNVEPAPITPPPPTGIDQIAASAPSDVNMHLLAAKEYFTDEFVRNGGHIDLYHTISDNATFKEDLGTNSEAVSYYLLWNAREGNKLIFDDTLQYMRTYMIHPEGKYLMWKLTANDTIEGDGENIASDADLRAIWALMIAEEQWGDQEYTRMIDTLAEGLERVAVTRDGYLAPYGGLSGDDPWTAHEVWLSYVNFVVIDELAQRRGEPWQTMYDKMKAATLDAQIHNGLFNSQLTETRQYGNGIDGGGYSINSLWILVRSAESDDPELREAAREGLDFYMQKYEQDRQLYSLYNSNGDALSPSDTPWVYALVGRAAFELEEEVFAEAMVNELLSHQIQDESSRHHGAITEGEEGNLRVGQFTMQESILTLIAFD